MKTFLLCLGFSVISTTLICQNIGINVTGAAPDTSALLDLNTSGLPDGQKRGFLVPRVTLTARNVAFPVLTPTAQSLVVYNTDSAGTPPNDVVPGFYYWDVSVWKPFIDTVYITVASPPSTCPPGFVRVPGRNYCIEPDERSQANWYDANDTCMSIGARLCSWGEWHNACLHSSLTVDNTGNIVPMLNMTGGNEWTMYPAAVGSAHIVGSANCDYTNAMGPATASPRFRCCFSFY